LRSIVLAGIYFSEVVKSNFFHRLQNPNLAPLLNDKEIQLLKLCATELTYQQIAEKMGIPDTTVGGYRMNLFEKFDVSTRTGLVVCGIQMGVVPVE